MGTKEEMAGWRTRLYDAYVTSGQAGLDGVGSENAFAASSIRQLGHTVGFDRVEVHPNPPVIHGILSLCRRVVWALGVLPARLLFAAETGRTDPLLTRSLLALAHR